MNLSLCKIGERTVARASPPHGVNKSVLHSALYTLLCIQRAWNIHYIQSEQWKSNGLWIVSMPCYIVVFYSWAVSDTRSCRPTPTNINTYTHVLCVCVENLFRTVKAFGTKMPKPNIQIGQDILFLIQNWWAILAVIRHVFIL